MQGLSVDYINARHEYWKVAIAKAGIWKIQGFRPVNFIIRRKSKTYNGMFQRKYIIKNFVKKYSDSIIIYNNADQFTPLFLDSVIVHEMIHQYIIQNNIPDTRTHGRIFREYMEKINNTFPGELSISIKSKNPSAIASGNGTETFCLLLVNQKDNWFCCVISPTKIKYFHHLLTSYKSKGIVADFGWGESNNLIFSTYRRCHKALHGEKKDRLGMIEFCRKYDVRHNVKDLRFNT